MTYTTDSIYKMGEIDHVRHNVGMYIGSTENPTKLIDECLDNALDELQAGFCNIIGVFINTKDYEYSVLDNGRGFPYDINLPESSDPPVISTTQLFTSGKFKKNSDTSAYKISSGLHGIGLTAVNALSDFFGFEIYNNSNKKALYSFKNSILENRSEVEVSGNKPFSTKVFFKPSKLYFEKLDIDIQHIEERLRLACSEYPNLRAVIQVDGVNTVIKGTTKELINQYLSDTVLDSDWVEFSKKLKNGESYHLKLAWDKEPPGTQKILTSVNLVKVHSGVHINKIYNTLRNVFTDLSKKYKYEFNTDDCLYGLRMFLSLNLIKTSFEAQVKVKLESKTDLSILDDLEKEIKKYLESNKEFLINLLEQFQSYRRSLKSKKITGGKTERRSSTKFTKLRDCKSRELGELIIGEGDSAIGGLVDTRDSNIHAILPLRGVIPNVLKTSNVLENEEIKDIINAIGTGIESQFDMDRFRYSKILLAADADPAGHFITTLLIVLFAKLTPDLIKQGKVFMIETPLYGYGEGDNFKPLWSQEDLKIARDEGKHIKRFKGLGEFNPSTLYQFTLNPVKRRLIPIRWSDKYKKLFELMLDSDQKKKLVFNEWDINDAVCESGLNEVD